ncbi:MAG: helix-turn-helix domain-containing protein, partial [Deltaproteobacteria bacterium]
DHVVMQMSVEGAPSSRPRSDELPHVLTVPELAEFLRISEKSVYALISGKHIPHIRVLRRVRFLKTDVLRFVQENRVSASEE